MWESRRSLSLRWGRGAISPRGTRGPRDRGPGGLLRGKRTLHEVPDQAQRRDALSAGLPVGRVQRRRVEPNRDPEPALVLAHPGASLAIFKRRIIIYQVLKIRVS